MRLITELQEAIRFVRLSRVACVNGRFGEMERERERSTSVARRDGRPVDPGIPTLQREVDEVTLRDDLERAGQGGGLF